MENNYVHVLAGELDEKKRKDYALARRLAACDLRDVQTRIGRMGFERWARSGIRILGAEMWLRPRVPRTRR